MARARTLWRHLSKEWPRWAQVAGLLLGSEQVAALLIAGREPNIGVMMFAVGLMTFQWIRRRE